MLRSIWVFAWTIAYRDKKVVGVFVFIAPLHQVYNKCIGIIDHDGVYVE
jgi:hypothetical protein